MTSCISPPLQPPPELPIALIVATLDAQATSDQATQAVAATLAARATDYARGTLSAVNATQTATLWTLTPTANMTASIEAYRTEQAATATQAWIDSWTSTPTPSPTLTPTLSPLDEAIQRASVPMTSNAEWQSLYPNGFVQDFDGVPMVLVPAGSFQMGSTVEEMQLGFEMCQQAVNETAECQRYWFDAEAQNGDNTQTFVQPFWIDLTEVSRGQYWACIEAGACEEIPTSDYSTEPDQPISQVTWFQAHAYCTWRGVRLPTESEWEYAARGPDRWLFPWGNQFNGALANHCDVNCGVASWGSDFDYVSEENNDGYALIAPVGSYPEGASWVGALDMSGNVWEWTHSLYRIYPYSPDDGRESTVEDSADGLRVLRGGSFNGTAFGLRATDRFVDDPDNGGTGSGFRCARSFAP